MSFTARGVAEAQLRDLHRLALDHRDHWDGATTGLVNVYSLHSLLWKINIFDREINDFYGPFSIATLN